MEQWNRREFLARSAGLAAASTFGLAACGGAGSRTTSSSTTSSTTTRTSSTPPERPPVAADWAALRSSLTGRLVLPGDSSYAGARLLYDTRFDDSAPAAIAYCANAEDVQRTIAFTHRHDLAPIPRCGGHSYGGYSSGSGLVLDVSPMRSIEVASTGSTARIGAGARLIDCYATLADAGVLLPAGSCPTVGIAGLALGGGIGVLGRRYGLTCDAIDSLALVTADSRLLTADRSRESDLHWASQGGGGGNFGVAVSFEFATHPIVPLALFTLDYPWAAAGELLSAWLDWVADAPDELWSNCLLLSAGSGGLQARSTGVFAGELDALDPLLDRLVASIGSAPSSRFSGPETYERAMFVEAGCAELTLAQCHLDTQSPPGSLSRSAFDAKSAYLSRALPHAGISAVTGALEAFAGQLPQFGGGLAFDAYGGAINRVAPQDTAFVHRDALCAIQMSVSWSGTSTPSGVTDWLADTAAAIAPFANGEAYQNYMDPTLEGWEQAYYGANLARLSAVKRRYDPEDTFHFAQSIPLT